MKSVLDNTKYFVYQIGNLILQIFANDFLKNVIHLYFINLNLNEWFLCIILCFYC